MHIMFTVNFSSTTVSTSNVDVSSTQSPIVDEWLLHIFLDVVGVAILFFSVMGVVTNTLNVMVFIKQGVTQDSTVISLFCLATSCLMSCLCMIPVPLCSYSQQYFNFNNWFLKNCYVYAWITVGYTHLIFSRITWWVIVYISIERATSVILPLKVKRIFTVKTSVVAMVTIYIVIGVLHIPFAANTSIVWVDSNLNTTIAALYETDWGKITVMFNNIFFSLVLPVLATSIVATATGIMLFKLRTASKWRLSMASSFKSPSDDGTTATTQVSVAAKEKQRRNNEMAQMISAVTLLFVSTTVASLIPALGVLTIPGMTLSSHNKNMYYLLITCKYLFDVINCSVDFFFYVKMSSKFRQVFLSIFQASASRTPQVGR